MGLRNHSAGVGSSGEPVEKRRLSRSVKQENSCVLLGIIANIY